VCKEKSKILRGKKEKTSSRERKSGDKEAES
jgi:hypothetical protein